jgi:hypothetical protein
MPNYLFGNYTLDVDERGLLRDNEEVLSAGKLFDTLRVLVENAGKLVRKDAFMESVWPDSVVEDNNLDYCISQLRKLFHPAKYIETALDTATASARCSWTSWPRRVTPEAFSATRPETIRAARSYPNSSLPSNVNTWIRTATVFVGSGQTVFAAELTIAQVVAAAAASDRVRRIRSAVLDCQRISRLFARIREAN